MAQFKPGKSGNPKGRPKGTKNANTPAGRLERALKNGADLVDLKRLALELVQDENSKMSSAQVEKILSKLIDTELKLLELDYKYNNIEESPKSEYEVEDDGDDVGFSSVSA